MDAGTVVSSDDVIESYRRQLSDANHRIAVLEAQVAKLARIMEERERTARIIQED